MKSNGINDNIINIIMKWYEESNINSNIINMKCVCNDVKWIDNGNVVKWYYVYEVILLICVAIISNVKCYSIDYYWNDMTYVWWDEMTNESNDY